MTHKVRRRPHSQKRSSVAFSTFPVLCNHPHHPSPELSHLPNQNSVPIKQELPISPPPAPAELRPTFRLCEFLATSYTQNQTVSVLRVRLTSLSIMSSRFIHLVAGVRISFLLRLHHIPPHVDLCYLFIRPSADGHPGCSYLLAVVNDAAEIMGVPDFGYFSIHPAVGLLGHMLGCCFIF